MNLLTTIKPESEKNGEPRNQVPEEVFESEEGWHEILKVWLNFVTIQHFWVK